MSTVRTAGTTPAGNAPRDRLRQRLAAARNKGGVDRTGSRPSFVAEWPPRSVRAQWQAQSRARAWACTPR